MVKINTNTVKINHLSWKNCTKVSSELLMNLFIKKLLGTMIINEIIAFIIAEINFGFIILFFFENIFPSDFFISIYLISNEKKYKH